MSPDAFVVYRARAAVQDVLADFGDLAISQFLRALDGLEPERLAALRALANAEDADVD